MTISIVALLFSFLFQGFISNYFSYTINNPSIFSTIYILISLVVILPFFEDDKKYLKLLVVFGLLMDIVYTNTFVLNTLIFLVIYYICKFINYFIPHNLLTTNLLTVISIVVYHILTFLILLVINYDSYSFKILFEVVTHSIIMTIIYGSLTYLIIKWLFIKFNIKTIK